MQEYRAVVLALLVSANAHSPGKTSSIVGDKALTCYADIKGFPAITASTSLSAETVLARVKPSANASLTGKQMPFGTRKFDECAEDSFGELSLGSMKELFRLVDLSPKDSFVDLGSGLGEVPVTAAVLSGVHHATGVELSKERHQSACEGLAKLNLELHGDSKSASMVELMQGDMMNVDLSDDTVVFTNSYCFRKRLLNRLAEKFAAELPEGARVASTKAFPDLPPRLAQVSAKPLPIGEGVYVSIYEVMGPTPKKGQKPVAIRMSKKQIQERKKQIQDRKIRNQALRKKAQQAEKKLSFLRKALQGN